MSRNGRRSLFNHSTDNIVRRRLRPLFALRGIIKLLIIQLDAPQELEPSARQRFIHNSNRELRESSRGTTRASLEHARAAIDDLVQSNANNNESFQTVHIIHAVDDKQLLRARTTRPRCHRAARPRSPSPRRRARILPERERAARGASQ